MFRPNFLSILSIVLLIILPLNIAVANDVEPAGELTALQWLDKDKEFQAWCEQKTIVTTSNIFPDSILTVATIRDDYCGRKIQNISDLQLRIVNLLDDLDRLIPYSIISLMRENELFRMRQTGELAPFEIIEIPDTENLAISLDHDQSYRIQDDVFVQCNNLAGNFDVNATCQSALREYRDIYNFAHSTLAQPLAFELSKRLGLLNDDWTDFYNESKSQTIWEMAINGRIFQKENGEHKFGRPPEWQLIFMHPNVVVENVKDALDGDQLKEAVMMEIIGADWWRQDKWYIPTGGSIVATYSDRLGVDDWGYGVAVNFDSQFTLGVTDHDGEQGVFITIDLLKLLQDKASILEHYRESVEF